MHFCKLPPPLHQHGIWGSDVMLLFDLNEFFKQVESYLRYCYLYKFRREILHKLASKVKYNKGFFPKCRYNCLCFPIIFLAYFLWIQRRY